MVPAGQHIFTSLHFPLLWGSEVRTFFTDINIILKQSGRCQLNSHGTTSQRPSQKCISSPLDKGKTWVCVLEGSEFQSTGWLGPPLCVEPACSPCGLSVGTLASSHSPKTYMLTGDSKLAVGLSVSLNGCHCVNLVIDWRPVHGVPWDRLQQKMDGFVCVCVSFKVELCQKIGCLLVASWVKYETDVRIESPISS